ncbi:GNAT family N-acetyltransferase [Microbacterium sp. NPDC056234]|uniref:GNAT family N-acetyltransferase n=1 Tax=Microbacterium sp. NPDC056234 TaxID=3345757 RepID=UPI0035DBD247
MPADAALNALDTDRLVLRRSLEEDARVFRQLWTERDERVPPHRRIDEAGHPTTEEIAANLRAKSADTKPGLLTVVRRGFGDVIGYCGVVFDGNGDPDEPELAFELLRAVHNRGYATEAGRAVLSWARSAGYRRIWASVWDWNVASRRALEKLGFTETGVVNKASEHGRSLLTVRTL